MFDDLDFPSLPPAPAPSPISRLLASPTTTLTPLAISTLCEGVPHSPCPKIHPAASSFTGVPTVCRCPVFYVTHTGQLVCADCEATALTGHVQLSPSDLRMRRAFAAAYILVDGDEGEDGKVRPVLTEFHRWRQLSEARRQQDQEQQRIDGIRERNHLLADMIREARGKEF